jgi:hypothetical protein
VAEARQIGWREVLIVAAVAVGVVLALDVVTSVVPGLKAVVTGTPVVVVGLVAGTAWLLWRLSTRRPPEA